MSLSHLLIEDFGASDSAATNAVGADEAWSGAPERPAAVRGDLPGGPRSGLHHPAGRLGMCCGFKNLFLRKIKHRFNIMNIII